MSVQGRKAVIGMFRKRAACLLAGLVLAVLCCGLASAEAPVLRCLAAGTEQYDIVISQQAANGLQYLMLPSGSSYSALCVSVSRSARLKGTAEDAAIDLPGGEWSVVDLTPLFGDMLPGRTYPLRIETDGETLEVLLIRSENLNSMHIMLDGSALPEDGPASALAYLHEDINNALQGWMAMIRPDGTVTSHAIEKIKGRGNTSWTRSGEKRPYNIKLAGKAALIDGGEEAGKWCLISNNCSYLMYGWRISDRTGIQNSAALQLYRDIGGVSALDSESVDLYIDGIYRGTYLLTDRVETGSGRVPVSRPVNDTADAKAFTVRSHRTDDPAIRAGLHKYRYTLPDGAQRQPGGFLLEIDFHYDKEKTWFVTRRGVQISFKEPEYATREQVQRIGMYIQAFEDALYADSGINEAGRHYSDYIDMDSWAAQFLMGCFFGNMDMFDSSTFLYADIAGEAGNYGRIFCGPAWDYDICEPLYCLFNEKTGGQHPQREYAHYNSIWLEQLLHRGDFMSRLSQLNSTVFRSAATALGETLGGWISRVSASSAMNEILWHNDFEKSTEIWVSGYSNRLDFWYLDLWSGQDLQGITIAPSDDGRTLVSHIEGTASRLQWYMVGGDGSLVPVPGADGPVFEPPENGLYCCAAEGPNIAFDPYAAEYPEDYTLNGIASVVTQPSVTMYSNIIAAGPVLPDGPDAPGLRDE